MPRHGPPFPALPLFVYGNDRASGPVHEFLLRAGFSSTLVVRVTTAGREMRSKPQKEFFPAIKLSAVYKLFAGFVPSCPLPAFQGNWAVALLGSSGNPWNIGFTERLPVPLHDAKYLVGCGATVLLIFSAMKPPRHGSPRFLSSCEAL